MTEAKHLTTEELRGTLRKDVDMSRYTSWRAGGQVERMYQPADLADMCNFLCGLSADEPLLAVVWVVICWCGMVVCMARFCCCMRR